MESWPTWHHDAQLTGVSTDPSVSTANAGSLGVKWMTNTGAGILTSPVEAWNAQLHEKLVYTANEAGYLIALDQATGRPVWSIGFGSPMRSSPMVEGDYVWIAPTYTERLYKINAATGAVACSAPLPLKTDASPVYATPPGGKPTVYIGTEDVPSTSGPLRAVDAATCTIDFSVTPEPIVGTGGPWDGISYAVDATGRGVVLFGTADPDSAVYAIDAITGKTIWRYATQNPPPGNFDVGAGITISVPGVNGFADGVAYAINKAGYLDALDLTTGALMWVAHPNNNASISTPALVGDELLYGDESTTGNSRVWCRNAITGAVIWTHDSHAGIDDGVAIVGPPGKQIVAYGDYAGTFHVLSLSDGSQLYQYQTGGYVVSAFAEDDGNLVDTSSDGFVYDLTPGGGNTPAPTTAVTSPLDQSTVANPDGDLTVSGHATAGTGGPGTGGPSAGGSIGAVKVAIQRGGTGGTWWDSATGTWTAAPYGNPATLATPGATSTHWTLRVPVPPAGGSYEAFASAVDSSGVADISATQSPSTPARSSFVVRPTTTAPLLTLSSRWVAPGAAVMVSGAGFAPDEHVDVTLNGSLLETITADHEGRFAPSGVTMPTSTPFGPSSLEATGETSGLATTAPVYLTNADPQFRYDPGRSGAEPNDTLLHNHLAVNGQSFLTQAWDFTSTAPIRSSPTVVQATAYFGNAKGDFYAVDIRTGIERWVTSVPGAGSIDSSAAVDPGVDGGIAVFGTSSGSVVALHTADGSPAWSRSFGSPSIDSSPAVVGGVVYIGSDSGVVYALSESTGATIWKAPLHGAVRSSPAVDPAAKLVVVGDDGGSITALSSATGAVVWTVHTAGKVMATPVVAGGVVYIGSEDATMYALKESSGAKVWSVPFGGPITASASLAGSTLYVGDSTGVVEWLTPSSGAAFYEKSLGAPVVGLTGTTGFEMSEASNGVIAGAKGPGQGTWSRRLSSTMDSAPTILNGEVFVTGEDGMLRCYTIPGQQPV